MNCWGLHIPITTTRSRNPTFGGRRGSPRVLDSWREIVRLTRIFTLMRNRRTNIGLLFLIATVVPIAPAQDPLPAPIVIDASAAPAPPQALPFRVGGQSPGGHVLSANDRYLMMDGTPWFPLMGEFHYSRYPENQWEKELLKIKAAGIQVISTYVFWIHHEEVEGEFNWTGQRDLRRFIELCSKHGLYVWLRIGPFDHGEVRNGGFPDWLLEKTPTRENNPVFLHYVRRFDAEIAKQVKGLFWEGRWSDHRHPTGERI